MSNEICNGYTNYETYSVALWILNDEGLYSLARRFRNKGYRAFAECLRDEFKLLKTEDEVSFLDDNLDYEELNEVLEDL